MLKRVNDVLSGGAVTFNEAIFNYIGVNNCQF